LGRYINRSRDQQEVKQEQFLNIIGRVSNSTVESIKLPQVDYDVKKKRGEEGDMLRTSGV
jgi:hypothetical protein